jgi:ribosomal protein S18 acetylase RimI-like enzyme
VRPVCLHSRDEIEAFLRRDTVLNLYEIGDLDDFFWQYTSWYALKNQSQVTELALIYSGTDLPVLLGHAHPAGSTMDELLQGLIPLLPQRFYAHLRVGGATPLNRAYHAQSHGVHYKMGLTGPNCLDQVDTSAVVPLTTSDLDSVQELYRESYPGNWFDPRMLETGCYFGIRRKARLVSVAGVHVFSPRYRVAALGNITTRPDLRGQGLGQAVTTRLCRHLLNSVDQIGLNVRTDNASAIACYKKLGFEQLGGYEEFMLEAKH